MVYHTTIFSIGGWTPNVTLKTTEYIFTNGHVANGPVNLPGTRAGHCLLKNSDTVILIGGYDPTNHTSYTSTVWMFDANNNFSLTVGPSMKHTRNHHACGIFQSSAHSGKVVSTFNYACFDCSVFMPIQQYTTRIEKKPFHLGRPLVVAAGGRGNQEDTPNTSEFWDFTVPGSEWQLSKSLSM